MSNPASRALTSGEAGQAAELGSSDVGSLVAALTARRLTIALAESLTAGLLSSEFGSVPGVSVVLRGAVITYATDTKHLLLGVDADLLAAGGPVQAEVAEQMARGVRALFGADLGIATTGVAGPGPADGHPAGTVFVAIAWGPERSQQRSRLVDLRDVARGSAGRAHVREGTVIGALSLLAHWLSEPLAS